MGSEFGKGAVAGGSEVGIDLIEEVNLFRRHRVAAREDKKEVLAAFEDALVGELMEGGAVSVREGQLFGQHHKKCLFSILMPPVAANYVPLLCLKLVALTTKEARVSLMICSYKWGNLSSFVHNGGKWQGFCGEDGEWSVITIQGVV